jgi:hypothetical protein
LLFLPNISFEHLVHPVPDRPTWGRTREATFFRDRLRGPFGLAQPLLAVVWGDTSSVDRFELAATSTLAWQGTTSSKIWANRGPLKLEKQ